MSEFQHVLFPVDFSARCKSTVPFVKEMVRSHHAKLTLLHVAEFPVYWYGSMQADSAIAWSTFDEIYEAGQKKLAAFAAEDFSDLSKTASVELVCERGDPGYSILARAQDKAADLIMMPTHGNGPFRSFLLGSATARVLHRAECAVWTGAHLEHDAAAAHLHIRNILCALDLEKESCRVIEAAVMLARTFSAQVRIVHCVPVPEVGPTEAFVSEFDRFLADSAREKLAKMQAQAGTALEVHLEGGSICQVVRDAAVRHSSDLLVIGRGHTHSPLSRLRSNAYAIIRNSPCPVLSL
jgi:nucleotide-binding universal stress UspA family protein